MLSNRSFAILSATALCLIAPWTMAKEMVPTPPETPVLGELEPVLVEAMTGPQANDDTALADVWDQPALREQLDKHKLLLFNGPVLGCVTDRSARVWVRTSRPTKVQVVVGIDDQLASPIRSEMVATGKQADLTALLDVTDLKPLTEYYYDVLIDGQSQLEGKRPAFKTAPSRGQPARFDVAFGGGARYVPEHEGIWDTIAANRPLAFLFLGDNIYVDLPKQRNMQRLYYYRRQLRPEYRRMSASTSIAAIWDDHDFGANDCAGGPARDVPDWKIPVWHVFQENWINPYYGGGDANPGCWFDFSIGDVDFFMTDGRYYRSFRDGTMLGPVQKQWLLDKLKASKATFKVIASGTLWTEYADKGGKDSWWGVPEEREEIFSLIDRENIGGVILISADRHRTDVYKIERPDGYPLYEFETSKLTNNHTHGTRPNAIFSYNEGNFYGNLTFDTTKPDPEITFQCIQLNGESVYSLTIPKSKLTR